VKPTEEIPSHKNETKQTDNLSHKPEQYVVPRRCTLIANHAHQQKPASALLHHVNTHFSSVTAGYESSSCNVRAIISSFSTWLQSVI